MERSEAAACFVARRSEGLTESEQELLSRWLAADPANAAEFERVDRAWEWFADPRDNEILSAMRAHALEPRARWWARLTPQAAAAAVLLLFAGLSVMFFGAGDWGAPSPRAAPPIRYASAGEIRQIELPDGSRMTLDARSEAAGSFGPGARSIELLRGRAFFDVRADRARPFSVTAGDRKVVALGTRFDVKLEAEALTVNLLEGAVTVGPLDSRVEPARLSPGQQFVERGGAAVIRKTGPTAGDSPGWTQGLLHFDDVPLAEAVAEVNRYAPIPIVVRSRDVAALRVSGDFRAGDGARFAETVAELHPIQVVRRADSIELAAE